METQTYYRGSSNCALSKQEDNRVMPVPATRMNLRHQGYIRIKQQPQSHKEMYSDTTPHGILAAFEDAEQHL